MGWLVDEITEHKTEFGGWKLYSIEKEKTVTTGKINEVSGGWEKIKGSLDSGAIYCVTNKETTKAPKKRKTEASKAGLGYRAADEN